MQSITPDDFSTIRTLVGHITLDDLRYVDAYVATNLCAFLPVGGNCGYAVTPEHTHNAYMFVVNYDDHTRVVVGEEAHTSRAGTIFCLSPHIPHHEVQDYLPPRYCAVMVEPAFFESVCLRHGHTSPRFDGERVTLHETTKSLLNHFLGSHANDATPRAMHDVLAESLAHALVRNTLTATEEPTPLPNTQRRINDAVSHIHAHYTRDISIDEIAAAASLSASHFRRLFKEEMGMNTQEYLLQVRMRHAKKMLSTGRHTVTECAMASGFNSASYFARRFYTIYGENPTAYLKRFK